jgi:2-isopropylmalate synthase
MRVGANNLRAAVRVVRARARAFSAAPAAGSGTAASPRLIIFDTTLRDGEQSPGATLQLREKVAIAHQLNRLGVDVCEAGFPIASPGDFEAVRTIAKEVGHVVADGRDAPMTIAGLARATEKDIERCYEAVRAAPRHRIHTFLATSDIHLEHKLRISRTQALERAVKAVAFAKSLCADVEFSTEDGGRSDPAFLVDIVGAVIEAGATTINVPDTVGYTLPSEYGALFAHLIKHTCGADRVVWSTHCHDDLGLATANSLAAVAAGARQVECTINGIGERAGNTSLEEIVMTLSTRPHFFSVTHSIATTQLMRASKLVSKLTGIPVQPNKAIVGANAFAHESGIHQDGMLKNASTYEIMTPESVGVSKTQLVLGKHSGRAAYAQRLKELGYATLAPDALDVLTAKLKALADVRKVITDADIEAIVTSEVSSSDAEWRFGSVHVFTGTLATPTATVTLCHRSGEERSASAMGTGPVDAVYNAIKAVVGRPNDLTGFSVRSVTDGQTALGEVTIKVKPASAGGGRRDVRGLARISSHTAPLAEVAGDGFSDEDLSVLDDETRGTEMTFAGTHTDKDIIMAAANAYLVALNKLLSSDGKQRVTGARILGTNSTP